MVKNFECPSCAAPLEYTGGATQFCEYCQSTVITPPELQPVRRFVPVQQQTVVDLRPYTRNKNGRLSVGVKWVIGLFIFVFLISILAPVILGVIGIIVSLLAAAAEL